MHKASTLNYQLGGAKVWIRPGWSLLGLSSPYRITLAILGISKDKRYFVSFGLYENKLKNI
jgi:hypothetical protein